MEKRLRWFLPVALLVISSLFFVGGPDAWSPLVFHHVWNLGHVVFFFCLVLWVQRASPLLFWRDWVWTIAVVLFIGIAIEIVQQFIGRKASVDDVLRNVYGVFLALSWKGGGIANRLMRDGFRIASVCLLLPSLWWAASAAYADLRMREQFPVINNFEEKYELQQIVRIGSQATRQQSSNYATRGHFSLAVNLGVDKYSGVKWVGRYGEWSNYKYFAMDVYNPAGQSVDMILKIADLRHDMGANAIDDRFNRRITLVPGQNYLRIDLDDIRTAPAKRMMQMDEISCLELFSVGLDKPRLVYVDYLRLE